jgi:multiple sugar transport system permease protein
MRKVKIFSRSTLFGNILFATALLCLFAVCLIQLYPLVWMVFSSFKDDIDVFLDIFGLPVKWHFGNYPDIFTRLNMEVFTPNGIRTYNFAQMFLNSALLAVVMPLKGIVSAVITAYIISKYKFKGSGLLVSVNICVMILPIVGALPSQLKVYNMLGMYDNLLLMALLDASPFGFGLLIYINAFKSVPNEFLEAARIDGAGHFRTFVKISLPVVLPTVAVFYLLGVLGSWNNYQLPLIWLPSYPNLALGMFQFQYDASKFAATLPQVLAGFVIVSVPSVIFYVFNQKLIASKMMIGGLKG